ncbi:FecR family protein [Nitrosovibrio sp. Nv17]|uniref:FecR family protein n=1 Tax=Nitrosovibrio sp. Nv17 TaxID=1855339 RepID=UPI000908ACEE|nr:FecR family protein [Nitrosovibrio sp. Nv17]SFW28991.1 FecR family protein [Nitrosovibrio sp. Nv17]
MPTVIRLRSWRGLLINLCILATAAFLGIMSWLIASPSATRLHETLPGERITFAANPEIDVSLDTDSSVTVSDTHPPHIELLRGNAYFDVRGANPGTLQIKVGTAHIRDLGTRFTISKHPGGGSVAVASGQIEIRIGNNMYLVGAHERADFSNTNIIGQRVIPDADIAPWRRR